mmetsp:Transcript_27147/g.38189  ORF Transcript_27147/g.38189 Transcript_27147/m.38189 type:complete len:100 (+) Transcript_27147:190-489(+)
MNKFITSLLLVALVASTSAFTSIQPTTRSTVGRITSSTPFEIPTPTTTTTTALNLKVKVDPEAVKKANNAGNAKMAAYTGSIAIALALPFAFLIWSALK